MKYLPFVVILFLVLGCDLGIYENPYKDCKYRPLTDKELRLIKSLETKTNKVHLFRTNYSYRPNSVKCVEDVNFYQISIVELDSLKKLSKDSCIEKARQIVVNVYQNILFDSLQFHIPRYEVSIKNTLKNPENSFNYCGISLKTDIESYLGWKLVRMKKGYKRIIIPKTKELKIRKGDCW